MQRNADLDLSLSLGDFEKPMVRAVLVCRDPTLNLDYWPKVNFAISVPS